MRNKKVLVSGCFDLLHAGHIAFFKTASSYGDLYVSIGRDENLLLLKGEPLLLLNKVLIFLLFLVPLTILIGRYVFQDSGYGSAHYLRCAGYALSMIILILLFSYSIVSLDSVHNFSPMISNLFTGADRIFWWHLAPLALLFVL